ncbi:hypothetical protein [Kitasatospora sp. NPDC057541]|uniref:hypothetical protein n=1 Tax=unclassified Kitasatospora TaxID=2633591 RepID=UPI0036CCA0E3
MYIPPTCQAPVPCHADATLRVVGYRLATRDLKAGHHALACDAHAQQLADRWTEHGAPASGGRTDPVIARTYPYGRASLYPSTLQLEFQLDTRPSPPRAPAPPAAKAPRRRTRPAQQPALWTAAVQARHLEPATDPDDQDDILVVPAFVRAVPALATGQRWHIQCRRTGHGDGDCADPDDTDGWRTVRTVSSDAATADYWALDHAEHHLPRNNLLTTAELAAAERAGFSRAQADILNTAYRGELWEDLNGYHTPDAGNWKPRAYDARRVRTLIARGLLHWTPDSDDYRRRLPLTDTGRTLWAAWVHARRCELLQHADTDTEAGVTDVQRDQYLMLRDEFPAERAAANERAKADPPPRPPLARATGHWYRPYGAPDNSTEQARGIEYDGHHYVARRPAEDQPIALYRADGGPALATGLQWWHQVEEAATAHGQAGGEEGRAALGPRPVITWGLRGDSPVTLHQVGHRWRDVECSNCARLTDPEWHAPGLGEHETEPAAVLAAVQHARHHEREIRAAMAKRQREDAVTTLAPVFSAELYAVLAAAANPERADGITYDGRTRYRIIPAGTPRNARRSGRPVRRELVLLLQRAGYLYHRAPGNRGPLAPTPDGRLAVEALADTALPAGWPTRKAPEKLPMIPEGWAERRVREQQDEHWRRIEAEHAERRASAPADTTPAESVV